MKPIIKWVGGKTQLLPEIIKNLPPTKFNRYIEPFLGGGAVLLELEPSIAIVNDLNKELINMYKVNRSYPLALMNKLDIHEANHSEDYYYKIRELDRFVGLNNLNHIFRASRFIFLNKAGFNGLYRVNSSGHMNVPFGKKDSVALYDKENIKMVSNYFKSADLKFENLDYFTFLEKNVKKGDFVYIDPPYDPISKTSAFTAYQKKGFNSEDQIKLRDMCIEINKRGAKFLLSNSNTEFIKELYDNEYFVVKEVLASRNINSNGEGRGKVTELLIKNYKNKGE